MDANVFKAAVQDGGGYDKIAMLFFDNTLVVVADQIREPFKESDFVMLGGELVYKEPVVVRNKRTVEYTEKLFNYHPIEYLQSIVMGDTKNAVSEDVNDMM